MTDDKPPRNVDASCDTTAADAFRRDAANAWTDYRANGLHVTSEEADAWLAKLEAGEDAAPPECHP